MLDLRWKRASPNRGSGNCWGILRLRRGLAENSLHAYRRDLENLSDFLSDRERNLQSADERDYREYLHAQSRGGKSDAHGRPAAGGDPGHAAVFFRRRRQIGKDPPAARPAQARAISSENPEPGAGESIDRGRQIQNRGCTSATWRSWNCSTPAGCGPANCAR